MTYIYSILLSIYIALGSSCTHDLSRLQFLMQDYGYEQYEPGSRLFFFLANILNSDLSVTIVHFLAVLIFLLSLRYFFLKTGLINSFDFFTISFISLFNPLSFEMVSNNTRQLLFISVFSISFYAFIIRKLKHVVSYTNSFSLKNINYSSFFVFLTFLFSFLIHSSAPIIFLFSIFYLLNLFVYKLAFQKEQFIKFAIKFKSKIKTKNLYIFLCFVVVLASFYFLLGNRLIYILTLYSPSASDLINLYQENNFGFEYDSPGLFASVVLTAFLILYSFFLIPKKFIFFRVLNMTLISYTTLMIYLGLTQPFLSALVRRTYQPFILIIFPVTLLFVFSIIRSKFKNLFLLSFLIIAIGWQSLKLGNMASSKDTFFSINNTDSYSCAPFRKIIN